VDRFWDLLQQSVIVSALIALVLVSTACYLWLSGQKVPEELYLLLGTVVGFFFGGKVERARIGRVGG
jgi:hypothetical protein